LPSQKLQDVLLEDPLFLASETGQAIEKQRQHTPSQSIENDPVQGTLLTTMNKRSDCKGGKSRLFDALYDALQSDKEKTPVEELDKTIDKESKPIVDTCSLKATSDTAPEQDSESFGPYMNDLEYLEDQCALINEETKLVHYRDFYRLNKDSDG